MFKNWMFHNIVAHPLMEILSLIGLKNLGKRIHDSTTPEQWLRSTYEESANWKLYYLCGHAIYRNFLIHSEGETGLSRKLLGIALDEFHKLSPNHDSEIDRWELYVPPCEEVDKVLQILGVNIITDDYMSRFNKWYKDEGWSLPGENKHVGLLVAEYKNGSNECVLIAF